MRIYSIRPKLTACMTALALGAAALSMSPVAAAADYPEQAIKAIVPFGTGGGNDILLRLIAKYTDDALGQPLVVDNKPGAGGQIGWTALATAKPDGYTVGATSFPSMVLIKAMRPEVPFELNDFTYICNIQADPIIWAVTADSPYASGKDFVEGARQASDSFNVAGDGPQSNIQLQHVAASKALDLDTNFVPFNGSNDAIVSLLGNHVDMAVTTLSAAQSHLDAGKLRALVVFADAPVQSIPDVPTASAEFGQPIASVGTAMRGLAAPSNMPADRLAKLETACEEIASSSDFQQEAAKLGLMVQYMDSQQAQASVDAAVQAVEEFKELLK